MTETPERKAMRHLFGSGRAVLFLALAASLAAGGCAVAHPSSGADWAAPRKQMVKQQLVTRGIKDARVLEVMGKVPRHEFVPDAMRPEAYTDQPLPIGESQTISQPYIVAYMTEVIDPKPGQKVLEVGTGSGYQAAVLAELVGEVYTIELLPKLA